MSPTVNVLYHAGLGLIFAGAGAALLFVLLYATLAPWWRSEVGRHLMTFTFTIFLALALTACNAMGWTRSLGLVPLLWIELAVFAAILLSILWRITILLRAQRRR